MRTRLAPLAALISVLLAAPPVAASLVSLTHALGTLPLGQSAELAAAYGFEETAGAAVTDRSGSEVDGRIENGAARTQDGWFGEAVLFDGRAGNVALARPPITADQFTFAAWVRTHLLNRPHSRIAVRSTGPSPADHDWMLTVSPDWDLHFSLHTDEGNKSVTSRGIRLFPEVWTHVAATYDGDSVRVYIDGVEAGRDSLSGRIEENAGAIVWIGDCPAGGRTFFGAIDEVRFYNRALPEEEIRLVMATPVEVDEEDLEPPGAPQALQARALSTTWIELEWEAAPDDFGVAGYDVFRDGERIAGMIVPGHVDRDATPGVEHTYEVVAIDPAGNQSEPSEAVSAAPLEEDVAPEIDVWYGDTQRYGHIGQPQPWVNVLGNVRSLPGIESATYSVNGGRQRKLSIGPDVRRLAAAGDFNVDLATAALLPGTDNQLEIRVRDVLGLEVSREVTIRFEDENIWPLPFQLEWSQVDRLADSVHVIDGRWELNGNSVRPVELGYDRLVGLGDVRWSDYEVRTTIVIHGFDSAGFAHPSNDPGVGFLLRWPGHSVVNQDHQPQIGFQPMGAVGWYRFRSTGQTLLQILDNNLHVSGSGHTLAMETPYVFKMRVATGSDDAPEYSLKVWPEGEEEPANWNVEHRGSVGDPTNGSLLLLSHHVDSSFGPVTVHPLDAGLSIVAQPQDATACPGSPVEFSVLALGSDAIFYQWFRGGQPIQGATGARLAIEEVGESDYDRYRVVVRDEDTLLASREFVLEPESEPAWVTEPVGASVCIGGQASFEVEVDALEPTYQWRKDGVPIPGAETETLALDPVSEDALGDYDVLVRDACGVELASAVATLDLDAACAPTANQLAYDCNQDGAVDIGDAICHLQFLFAGGVELPCGTGTLATDGNRILLDWNGDTGVDISDATSALSWLFLGMAPHVAFVDARPVCIDLGDCPVRCES